MNEFNKYILLSEGKAFGDRYKSLMGYDINIMFNRNRRILWKHIK